MISEEGTLWGHKMYVRTLGAPSGAIGTHFGGLTSVSPRVSPVFFGLCMATNLKMHFGGDRFLGQLFGHSQERLGGNIVDFAGEGL